MDLSRNRSCVWTKCAWNFVDRYREVCFANVLIREIQLILSSVQWHLSPALQLVQLLIPPFNLQQRYTYYSLALSFLLLAPVDLSGMKPRQVEGKRVASLRASALLYHLLQEKSRRRKKDPNQVNFDQIS